MRRESVAFNDDAAAVTTSVEGKARTLRVCLQGLAISTRLAVVRKELEVDEIERTPARFGQLYLVLVVIEIGVGGETDVGRGQDRTGGEARENPAAIGELAEGGDESGAAQMHQVVERITARQVDDIARQNDSRGLFPCRAGTRQLGIVSGDAVEMGPAKGLIAAFEAAKERSCPVRGVGDVSHADLLLGSLARPAEREREQALMDEGVSAFLAS